MRRATIVQVHLGKELPPYVANQLRQSRILNPSENICLLIDSAVDYEGATMRELGVTVVLVDRLAKSRNHARFARWNQFRRNERGRFWRYAFERFFAIETFLEACPREDIVHLENDVMLYARLESLLPKLREGPGGIKLTMDSERRCIPGFVYIRDRSALAAMNEALLRRSLRKRHNDMEALALYLREEGSEACSALPVVPEGYRKEHGLRDVAGREGTSPWYDEEFPRYGGVFDAAALGQFLGGIDRIHQDGDSRGFVNETAVYDPRLFDLHWRKDDGLLFPYGRVKGLEFPLFNLHIHSKQLEEFSSERGASSTLP